MMGSTIPAVYHNGTFQLLEEPTDLVEQQHVQLFYVALNDTFTSPSLRVEEDDDFVDQMMGIWRVDNQELRRWVAEEVSLFDDGE